MSGDGRWVASVHGKTVKISRQELEQIVPNHRVYLWDLESADAGMTPWLLTGVTETPRAIAFSPESDFVLAAASGQVCGWKATDSPELAPAWTLDPPGKAPAADNPQLPLCVGFKFSPNGSLLVAAWSDGRVGFWRWKNGPQGEPVVRTTTPLEPYSRSLAITFAPTGKWLALTSTLTPGYSAFDRGIASGVGAMFGLGVDDPNAKGTIHCWKITDSVPSEQPTTLSWPNNSLKCLAFSRNGERLAAGDMEKNVRLWQFNNDGPSGEPLLIEHYNDTLGPSGIDALDFWPDDRWLISTGASNTRLWRLDDLKSDQANRESAFMLPGGDRMHLHPEKLWMVTSADVGRSLMFSDMFVATAHQQPDAEIETVFGMFTWMRGTVAERNYDRISLRNPHDAQLLPGILPLRSAEEGITALAWCDAKQLIVTGDRTGQIRVWDLSVPSPFTLPWCAREGWDTIEACIAVSADSTRSLTLQENADSVTVRLYDLFKPEITPPIVDFKLTTEEDLMNSAWSPDGRWLAACQTKKPQSALILFDLQDTQKIERVFRYDMPKAGDNDQLRATISASGRWLLLRPRWTDYRQVENPDSVVLWDLTAPEIEKSRRMVVGHVRTHIDAAFSGDSRWLATVGDEALVRLYDLNASATGGEVAPRFNLACPAERITAVAFLPGGEQLVCADDQGNIYLWQGITSAEPKQQIIAKHDDLVQRMTVSPDGQWLASFDALNRVRLTALKDPKFASTPLHVVVDGNDSLVFSPDSRWLALPGDENHPLLLWDMTSQPLAEGAIQLMKHWQPITEVEKLAFTADSKYLISGGMTSGVSIWPLDITELIDLAYVTAGRELNPAEQQMFLGRVKPQETITTPAPQP